METVGDHFVGAEVTELPSQIKHRSNSDFRYSLIRQPLL